MVSAVDADLVTPSRRLGEWAAILQWKDLPETARTPVRLRVLDTMGLVMVGAGTPAVTAARAALVPAHGLSAAAGVSGSTVVGGGAGRMAPGTAALIHGVAAHCRDFDDTFVDSVIHPGSVVVPAALAVAEAVSARAEDFAVAIVAGYEVAARIGAVAGRRFHARGLHATGVVGPIAAAVTAGRILGLSGEQMSWAIGLAASMSGGLMAFTIDGGWSKWLHAGWAAQGGISAAYLAQQGFRGPEHVLAGGLDLYSAFLHGDGVERSALTQDLGLSWPGARAEFKYYPCAHVIHPYIDAVLELVRRHDLLAEDIECIECAIAPWAAAIVAEPRAAKLRFDSELEAIASLPYQLAVAVLRRRVDLGALTAEQRAQADLRSMAERIVHRSDPRLGRGFDGRVELRTRAGACYGLEVAMPGSDAGRLREKFIANAAVHGTAWARSAAEALLADELPDWRVAASLLAGMALPG